MAESFKIERDADGIAMVTFDRPPVNAMAQETYVELGELCAALGADDAVRVVVLRAPDANRAWCGGADLNQLAAISPEDRARRYQIINAALDRFYNLNKPLIGALNGSCLGVGMVLASLCDMRVAADDAKFAFPETQRGMPAPLSAFLSRLGMPGGFVREMLYTGAQYAARDIAWTGFFNYVTPRGGVVEKAVQIAQRIAKNRPAAVEATKTAANRSELIDWAAKYQMGQESVISMSKAPDAKKEIRDFLKNG